MITNITKITIVDSDDIGKQMITNVKIGQQMLLNDNKC